MTKTATKTDPVADLRTAAKAADAERDAATETQRALRAEAAKVQRAMHFARLAAASAADQVDAPTRHLPGDVEFSIAEAVGAQASYQELSARAVELESLNELATAEAIAKGQASRAAWRAVRVAEALAGDDAEDLRAAHDAMTDAQRQVDTAEAAETAADAKVETIIADADKAGRAPDVAALAQARADADYAAKVTEAARDALESERGKYLAAAEQWATAATATLRTDKKAAETAALERARETLRAAVEQVGTDVGPVNRRRAQIRSLLEDADLWDPRGGFGIPGALNAGDILRDAAKGL